MTPNPTAADLKARYPEFTGVSDATVTIIIGEVSPMVDSGWVSHDQAPGVLALAAHVLFTEGQLTRPSGGSIDPTGRVVMSRKVGDVAVTYGRNDGGGSKTSEYATSVYGRHFLRLLRLNAPAAAAV